MASSSLSLRVLALSLGLSLFSSAAVVRAADEEMVVNPQYTSWSGHKIGTVVTLESSSSFGGQKVKSTMEQKLVELTPEKAVIEATVKLDIPGVVAPPAQRNDVPAKVKKSEATLGQMPAGVKAEAKEAGSEKLTIAGREYTCKVVKFTGEQQGMKSSGKLWSSEKIPGTLAKLESTSTISGMEVKTTLAVTKIVAAK